MLVKRHITEDCFGVQLADSDPEIISKAAVLLANELNIDFIDLNSGCPIDLVTNYGAGSALMNREKKLYEMLKLITEKTKGEVPVGVKMRKGWNSNKPNAHKLCCKIQSWTSYLKFGGAIEYVAVHGRSRQQRYTKLCDWDYIYKTCARISGRHCLDIRKASKLSASSIAEERMQPLKVFGNGDILSYLDWEQHLTATRNWFEELDQLEKEDEMRALTRAKDSLEIFSQKSPETPAKITEDNLKAMKLDLNSKLTTCILARGVLTKPWLCQEIKEKRHLDISSNERLDMLKKYVDYELLHWGSDRKGVNNTRRFLLEWMSFLYRYIPVGIIDTQYIPQKINDRPPRFQGRNKLETLMGSPSVQDWIKVSEMLLGPVEEGFMFTPKHKANAYEMPTQEVVKLFQPQPS